MFKVAGRSHVDRQSICPVPSETQWTFTLKNILVPVYSATKPGEVLLIISQFAHYRFFNETLKCHIKLSMDIHVGVYIVSVTQRTASSMLKHVTIASIRKDNFLWTLNIKNNLKSRHQAKLQLHCTVLINLIINNN